MVCIRIGCDDVRSTTRYDRLAGVRRGRPQPPCEKQNRMGRAQTAEFSYAEAEPGTGIKADRDETDAVVAARGSESPRSRSLELPREFVELAIILLDPTDVLKVVGVVLRPTFRCDGVLKLLYVDQQDSCSSNAASTATAGPDWQLPTRSSQTQPIRRRSTGPDPT